MMSVVAVSDQIPPGHELTTSDLTLIPIGGKVQPPHTFNDIARLVGRVTAGEMVAGQPVIESLLAPQGVPAGLQALIPNGMRAITLEISESGRLGGLLLPGSHVDVVATATDTDKANTPMSRAIVQNVKVLGIGQRLGTQTPDGKETAPPANNATLLVTPHDAEAIDLAANTYRLRLTFARYSKDSAQEDDQGVMLAETARPRRCSRPHHPRTIVVHPHARGAETQTAGVRRPSCRRGSSA